LRREGTFAEGSRQREVSGLHLEHIFLEPELLDVNLSLVWRPMEMREVWLGAEATSISALLAKVSCNFPAKICVRYLINISRWKN
jgi:hypothetical protein